MLLIKGKILGDVQIHESLGKPQFVQVIPGDVSRQRNMSECICLCRQTGFVR